MRILLYLLCLIAVLQGAETQGAILCDPTVSTCMHSFYVGVGPEFINYFSNYDLSEANPAIKRVVIAIEGNQRNAKSILKSIYTVTKSEKQLAETMIVAPWFKGNDYGGTTTCTDGDCDAVSANEVYWSTNGWKEGDETLIPPYISSFEVADRIVRSIIQSNLYPSLQSIIITGHSAGGQFTQRYALGTRIEQEVGSREVQYVVANPSSYLYLDSARPSWSGLSGKYPAYGLNAQAPEIPQFMDPYSRVGSPYTLVGEFASITSGGKVCSCSSYPCPYERFKYGFDLFPRDPEHYMCFEDSYQSCMWPTLARDQTNRFLQKKVTYILGRLDNFSNPDANTELDVSCGGNFQGIDRLSRGTYYYESLSRFGAHRHRLLFAPQVAHDASLLYQSYPAVRSLFGGELPVKQYLAPVYTIVQKATNRFLDAQETSPFTSMTSTGQKSTQRWILTQISPNEYRIQQEKTLRYLEALTSSTYSANIKVYREASSQIWGITPVNSELQTYRIQQKANGRYLDANVDSGYTVNTQLQQSDGTQEWIIRP